MVTVNIFIQVQHNAIDARDALPDDYKFANDLIMANTVCPRLDPEAQLLADEAEAIEAFFTDVSVNVSLREHLRTARK